jgi:outer membrane protein TolC
LPVCERHFAFAARPTTGKNTVLTRSPIQVMFILVALAGTVVTVGCAHFRDQPISPEQSQADFDARCLSDPALHSFIETNRQEAVAEWPPSSWDLTNLTLAAFYFHPALEVARAQVATADAGTRTAGQRPNPTLAATPGYDTTSSGISPWIVNVSLDVPIETAGKRSYRIAEAEHRSQAARLREAGAVWQVRSGVRHALLDLHAARENESVLQTQVDVLGELVRLLDQQQQVGALAPVDVAIARVDYDNARLGLAEAHRQRAEGRVALAGAIGVPASALADVAIAFPGLDSLPTSLVSSEMRREAVLHRSDILAALAEYAASQSALQLEIAKQYPDVHLNPGYEFDQGDNKWMLGLSLELPMLNHNQGPIAEAMARRREAAARFNAIQATAIGEIDRAVAGYLAATEQVGVADSLLAEQQKRERFTHNLLTVGEVDRIAALTVQAELTASRRARVNALVQAQQALIAVEDAVQLPLPWPAGSNLESPRADSVKPVSQ